MSIDDCIPDTQTNFTEVESQPGSRGIDGSRARRDGRLFSAAEAHYSEPRVVYEARGTTRFFVEPALGVRVTATIDVQDGESYVLVPPFTASGRARATLLLTVRNHLTGTVICSASKTLLDTNPDVFDITVRDFPALERVELSCFGDFGTVATWLDCEIVLRTGAWSVIHAAVSAEVDMVNIRVERCCVRPLEPPEGMIPLFRWYSRSREDNFTTSQSAWAGCHGSRKSPDFTFSRCEGFIFDPGRPQPDGTLPLFSWWNPAREDNMITSDPRWGGEVPEEKDGYHRFRLEGYVLDPRGPASERPEEVVPLYSWWNADRKDNFCTSDPRWIAHLDVEDIRWNGESITNGPRDVDETGYDLYRLEGFALT